MKDFLKYTLATVAGIILSGCFLLVGGIVLITWISFMSLPVPSIKKDSILKIDLNGMMEERYTPSPWDQLLGNDYPTIGLDQLRESILKAAEIPQIKGIYLKAGNLNGASPAMLEELRNALLTFRKSGKPILAYGDTYSQGCYYLCSAADKVVLNPSGQIAWQGMASEPVFYKDLLDKIGIQMQVFRVGSYKSAVEPFTSSTMSSANREQIGSYLNSIWQNMLVQVSDSRGQDTATLNRYADEFLSFMPAADLRDRKMADTLLYKDDFRQLLCSTMNQKGKPAFVTPQQILANEQAATNKQKVAVYYAYGDIVQEKYSLSQDQIAAEDVCRDLEDLGEDKGIKAVVIRINSGGGSAYASEQIWHAIRKLRQKKPVVVSMGGMAASGGYYMACAADEIVTLPTTLTGSIGIFGMIPDASGLLKEKLGLNFDVVKTNRHADFGSMGRPFNTTESAIMQRYVDQGYELFIKRVAEGRKMPASRVMQLAQGRVWTGSQALESGLADSKGDLYTAIGHAAQRAGIQSYQIVTYPKPLSWYEELMDNSSESYLQSTLKETLGSYYQTLSFIKNIKNEDQLQARMPYDPNIK